MAGLKNVAGCSVSVLAALSASVAVIASPAQAEPANPLTELVDAAAQRLQVAEPVAAVKWATAAPIEDPVRVADQLAALAAQAAVRNIDPDYVTRVFADQIAATEAVEYDRFARWKLDPSQAPANPPELSASRAVIDTFNQAMLAQIGQQWELLHSPGCADRLEAATLDAGAARHFDEFARHALAAATRSYCQPQ